MFRRTRRPSPARPAVRPNLVTLEDRSVPAAFFVDPQFAGQPAGSLEFNNGLPGQGADKVPAGGLVLGTNAFLSVREAVEAANATVEADQIYLPNGPSFVNPNGTPVAGQEDVGTTVGTIQVTSDIDLIGQGSGISTVEVTDDTDADSGDTAAVFLASGGVSFNVTGLALDGLSTFVNANTGSRYTVGNGFRYSGANGTLTDVTVRNVQFDPAVAGDPVLGGIGVAVLGPDAAVTVTAAKFINNGRAGVTFFETTAGTVDGSTIVGRGTTPAGIASYGVEILRSTGITVTNNSIYGHTGNGGGTPISAAVSVADTLAGSTLASSAFLGGNDLFANSAAVIVGSGSVGMLDDASTATLRQNNIDSNGTGIVTATTATVDAKSNFWGSAAGPLAVGNATASGDNPGGNADSEVDSKVDYRPFLAAAVTIGAGPTPAVTAPGVPPLSNSPTQTVTIRFSEPVTGFDETDIVFTGTAPGGTVTGIATVDGQTYTLTLDDFIASGTVVISADAGAATSTATGLPSAALPATLVATLDLEQPVPTVTVPGDTPPLVGLAGTLTAVVTFDEPVTGLDATAFTVSDGTVQAVTQTGATAFVVTVGGFTTPGVVMLAVNPDATTDAAGNTSVATDPVVVGTAADPVTVTVTAPGVPPLSNSPTQTVTIRFSEPVTGFDETDIVFLGTAAGGVVTGVTTTDDQTFTVTLDEFIASGTVVVAVDAGAATGALGNSSAALAPTLVATLDLETPLGTISPLTDPAPRVPLDGTLSAVVTFDEPVSGLDASGLVVSDGVVQSVTQTSPTSFLVTVGGFTADGQVMIAVSDGAVTDAAGNAGTAVDPVIIGTAGNPVTVTVTAPGVPPLSNSPTQTVTIQFSEPVAGFDAADIVFTGTAPGGTVTGVTSTDNQTFTVTLSDFIASGTVVIGVDAGAATGVALGQSTVALPATLVATLDLEEPIATVAPGAGTAVLPSGTLTAVVSFDEPVSGLTAAGLTVGGTAAGGTVQSVTQTGPSAFQVVLGGFTTAGTVTLAVNAGAAADPAGNASLADAAVGVGSVQAAPVVPPTTVPFAKGFVLGQGQAPAGSSDGGAAVFAVDNGFKVVGGVVPFAAGFTGGVRVASGDVNGDGSLDIITASGPGAAGEVRVYSGANPAQLLVAFFPFEAAFTGGLFVAAGDVTGDGKADIVITPDVGGGARVLVADGAATAAGGKLAQAGNFFAFPDNLDFRGGARPAVGDINGDGRTDIVIGAGFGGGPRVSTFDGKTAGAASPTVISNFFAFDGSDIQTLRNGVFVSAADINGDGKAELFVGGGPGGGPRVRGLNGADTATPAQFLNFFAGDTSNRGGVRVLARDLDGDGRPELVTAPGEGGGSKVTVYTGAALVAAGNNNTPAVGQSLDLFGGFTNGVFVG